MTPEARKSLAEQLLSNPLFDQMLAEMEAGAIEALIHAKTEQSRIEAQWRVNSARNFRSDCQAALDSDRKRKSAPA